MIKKSEISKPKVGYFKTRLGSGAAFVPARIYIACACTIHGGENNETHTYQKDCDRFGVMICEINGHEADLEENWPQVSRFPISQSEWEYMEADAIWCDENAKDDYKARPREKVDFVKMKPLY